MSQKTTIIQPCQSCAETSCCRSGIEGYSNYREGVISPDEINKIEHVIGRSDFYEKNDSYYTNSFYYTFKLKPDGYCVFFDKQKEICTIYDIRPIDCRLFPLDFEQFNPNENDKWILWNCLYSEQLDETTLEKMMTNFEDNFAKGIKEIWNSGIPIANLKETGLFRILREVKL